MGIAGRIDNDPVDFLHLGRLYAVNEHAFVVALKALKLSAAGGRRDCQLAIDICQRFATIDVWLARPKKIQVGAVQYENPPSVGVTGSAGTCRGFNFGLCHGRSLPQIGAFCLGIRRS